jgi:hypothetical protein
MKKIIFLSLIIALIIGSCAKQKSKFPQGVWQMVQVQRVANGKSRVTFPTAANKGKITQIKMWSEKYWMFVGSTDRDTVIIDTYGGGTYTLEGIQYVENILYHSGKAWVGVINKNMTLELVNDSLVLSYHPIRARDKQLVDSVTYFEKYVRLE